MSFATREASIQEGKPVFLVKFYRTGKAWYYTNADQDITFDSQVYTSVPVSVTSIVQSGDAKAENFDITLPSSATLSQYVDGFTPTEMLAAMIRKVHMDEDIADGSFTAPTALLDAPVVWVGEVINVRRPSVNARVFVCNTLSLTMARGGLRLAWGRQCPHVLYGRGCNLDKADFAVPLTGVSVVNGITLAADQFTSGFTSLFTLDQTDPASATEFTKYSKCSPASGATVHIASYDPASAAYLIRFDENHNPGESAFMKRNFRLASAANLTFDCDVRFDNIGQAFFLVQTPLSGAGGIQIYIRSGTDINIQSAGGYDRVNFPTSTIATAACPGLTPYTEWYTLHVTITDTGLGTRAVVAELLDDTAAVVATVSGTSSFAVGDYAGFGGAFVDDAPDVWRIYYRNIHVEGVIAGGEAAFSGGFIEWESEPGVLERTGIESQGAGTVTLFGTTIGMASGDNFVAYPGCPRTADACNSVFNNMVNYGGINHLQGKSPFTFEPLF